MSKINHYYLNFMSKEINQEKVQSVLMSMAIAISLKKTAEEHKDTPLGLAYSRAMSDYGSKAGATLRQVISGEPCKYTECKIAIVKDAPMVSLGTLEDDPLTRFVLEGDLTAQYGLLMAALNQE